MLKRTPIAFRPSLEVIAKPRKFLEENLVFKKMSVWNEEETCAYEYDVGKHVYSFVFHHTDREWVFAYGCTSLMMECFDCDGTVTCSFTEDEEIYDYDELVAFIEPFDDW